MPSQITYWTVSYIKSQGTRFHALVTNRVAKIKEVSDPEAWRMSLDASMLRTIVQEVFLLKTVVFLVKTVFETAGGLTAQTFFCG